MVVTEKLWPLMPWYTYSHILYEHWALGFKRKVSSLIWGFRNIEILLKICYKEQKYLPIASPQFAGQRRLTPMP